MLGVFLLLYLTNYWPVDACGRSGPPPDRTRPTITCPADRWATADPLQINTKVWWNEQSEVSALDDVDGVVQFQRMGSAPGRLFSEGVTKISYHTKDKSGNYASCVFRITVKVRRCTTWTNIPDGWKICHVSNDMRLGTVCRFGCYAGHTLEGPSETKCLESQQWDNPTQPYCRKLQCEVLLPAGEHYDKIECTDGRNYRSMCTYYCKDGYGVLPGKNTVQVCSAYGTWLGETPTCIDKLAPVFVTCPHMIVGYADRSKSSGQVWWNTPIAKDNSDIVTVVLTSGPSPNTVLDVGDYTVEYIASDGAQNTATCTFKVIVKQIRCHSLYPLPHTSVVCPAGRIYGSTCNFTCDNGTSINGEQMALCEKAGNTSYYGSWSFGNYQPYCENLNPCSDLPVPDNGALVCDTWYFGRYCQMLCEDGHVVIDDPDTAQNEVDLHKTLLVCSDSGIWYKSDKLPDCQEVSGRDSVQLRIGVSYLYYSGKCDTTRRDIKIKFLEAFKKATGDACEPSSCRIEAVKIVCGETKRGKRDSNNASDLTFEVSIVLSPNVSTTEIVKARIAIKTNLERAQSDGDLDFMIDDIAAIATQVKASLPEVRCENGSAFDHRTLQCVACKTGYMHDESVDLCVPCPRGSYQGETKQSECKSCDPGKTTTSTGSTSVLQCEDACPCGYFSATGTTPCSPCDLGYYTSTEGNTQCTACPGAQITLTPGANSVDRCQDFDILYTDIDDLEIQSPATLLVNETFPQEFAVNFWLKCSSCQTILDIVSADETPIMSLGQSYTFDILFVGINYTTTGQTFRPDVWQKIALICDADYNVTLLLDDKVVWRDNLFSEEIMEVESFYITLGGCGFVGHISQFNMWNTSFVLGEKHTNTCFVDNQGDLVHWTQFSELDGAFAVVASTCDAIDDCQSMPCNNNGSCHDIIDGYLCTCVSGYNGSACEENIDDCIGHACDNGATCVDVADGYTCACGTGYTGNYCELQVVDGAWTEWQDSSECSVSCGNGFRQRSRVCENPYPVNGGKECIGEATEYTECLTNVICINDCLTDPPQILNGDLNCTHITNQTRVCHPVCHEGFDFDSITFISNSGIVCGPETGFTWSHSNEDNPNGFLPSCTPKVSAKENRLNYTAEYPTLLALTEDLMSDIMFKVNESVIKTACVAAGQCEVQSINVYVSETDANREKRASTTVMFTVQVSCNVIKDIDECYDPLFDFVTSLENFVAEKAFTVPYGNVSHDVRVNGSSISGTSVCDPGHIPVWQYCVSCGKGTNDAGGFCSSCPKGYYQDNMGTTSCKQCPIDWTTAGVMSRDINECKVPDMLRMDRWLLSGIWTGVGVLLLLITVLLMMLLAKRCRHTSGTSTGNE